MEQFLTPEFWVAVGQIIMIDILLGGDNAVVIALACRKLPPAQRARGILWGTAGAIALRVVLIFFALTLLAIPFLKLTGALLLAWIGVKLLLPAPEGGHGNVAASDRLWAAVKTIIVADLVMSVDNVIAIAGAAQGAGEGHRMTLVVFGLLASIPIIVWGSQGVIRLMERFPVIITLGGMLLGWIAGTMAVSDPALADPAGWPWTPKLPQDDGLIRYAAGAAGALLVLVIGKWTTARRARPGAAAARPARIDSPSLFHPPTKEGASMEKIILYVDDASHAREFLARVTASHDDAGARQWLLVACAPRMTRHVGRWVSPGAHANWRAEWFEELQARLRPLLLEHPGSRVTPLLAKGPLTDLTRRLRLEHGAARVIDARYPKVGVDLEPVAPDVAPPGQSGWAVPGGVVSMFSLLMLANELSE
jgi:YjbE family integral membrane protein